LAEQQINDRCSTEKTELGTMNPRFPYTILSPDWEWLDIPANPSPQDD